MFSEEPMAFNYAWVVLLFNAMNASSDTTLSSTTETVYECPDCGRRYHGDPYYLPNCCDNCGGVYQKRVLSKTSYVMDDDGTLKKVVEFH